MTANVSTWESVGNYMLGAAAVTGTGVLAGCVVGGPVAGAVYGVTFHLVNVAVNLTESKFNTELNGLIPKLVARCLLPLGVALLAFSLMGIPITFGATVLLGVTHMVCLLALSLLVAEWVDSSAR